MKPSTYVIQGGVEGRDRLRLLTEVFGLSTRALFSGINLSSDSICLDVGCGAGDGTFEMANAIGPSGRLTGVDMDATKIEMAQVEARERGLSNITFEVGDITQWEPRQVFDVIYARFLLTHLTDPGELLALLSRHLRLGGVIVIEDIDFRGHFCEPHCPALSQYVDLYTSVVQRRGGDPHIGPRLPGLLREAGLTGIQMKVVQPVALEGGIKLLSCVTLERIAAAVLEDELLTENELHELIGQCCEFASDPQTVHGGPRVFQVWGRKVEIHRHAPGPS